MSATHRFWTSTSFDHAQTPSNQINPTNVELIAKLAAERTARKLSPSPAPSVRHPQYQQTLRDQQQTQLHQHQQQPLRSSSSGLSSNSTTTPAYMFPSATASPAISAPSTPVLLAKELPLASTQYHHPGGTNTSLAGSVQPQTPSGGSSLYVYHPAGSAAPSPSPSPARALPPATNNHSSSLSSSVHPDMYYYPHPTPALQTRPLLFRHAHSRSSSFSSTNNNVFPSSSLTSSPTPSSALALPPSTAAGPIIPSTVPPTPASRRTSLIATSLANAIANNLALSGMGGNNNNNYGGYMSGPPSSVPMSPTSSYGLPSPTFPPRPLPSSAYAPSPARPPRSPARPAIGALGLTPLTSLPPSLNSSPSPILPSASTPTPTTATSHNYNAPIPRPARPSTGQGSATTATGGVSLSRRNSRQVSVRLSAAFIAPPTTVGSTTSSRPVSRSTSRAPTEVGDYYQDYDISASSGRTSRNEGSQYGGGNGEGNGNGLEVLKEGDIIGQGSLLRGQVVRAVPPSVPSSTTATTKGGLPALHAGARYEVVRSLGAGSYAVVYLVKEILPSPTGPAVTAPGTPARSYMGLGLQPFTSATANSDVFDEEDVFGLVHQQQPSPVLSLSNSLRSTSHRSAGGNVRRSSLLKPIDEHNNSSLSSPTATKYGREFAIKVLSKSNLDEDELAVQMTEVTIHQSLGEHGNIVTLYGALETDELLMLVLEYVPGEDLYYFLEQQQQQQGQDEYDGQDDSYSSVNSSRRSSMYGSSSSYASSDMDMDMDELDLELEPSRGRTRRAHRHHHQHGHHRQHTRRPTRDETAAASLTIGTGGTGEGGTPPTPSLLSSVHPAHMLSYGRLKLIASMFGQMCDAVEACHAQGISHRDIKPENFIVTTTGGKVIVKLSDFGLATMDRFSADVDCGSAPYMSYECRNVVGPTYATQPADVWSLGIVLINMLYHHNLWQDTFEGDSSFEEFRQQPVAFLMQRSPGMTRDVAEFLAERVFRILPESPATGSDPAMVAQFEKEVAHVRVTAGEFGEWARHLPALFYSAGAGPSPLATTAGEAAVASAVSDSKRFSLDGAIAAGLIHTPNCAFSQLHEHAFDEDDEESEMMLADKTFTQADAGRGSLDHERDGILNDLSSTPMVPGLLSQSQSSPSTASSGPISPRSPMPRTMTPLPAEPMPLAQPVVDVNLSDLSHERSNLGVSTSTNGECIACTYDEQLGLGLTGATTLNHDHHAEGEGEGEDSKRSASGIRSRKRGQRRKKDASVAPSSAAPSVVSSPHSIPQTTLPSVAAAAASVRQYDLEDLAQDTQNFAREISRTRPASTTRQRSTSRSRSRAPAGMSPLHQTAAPPLPALMLSHPSTTDLVSPLDLPNIDPSAPSLPPSVVAAVVPSKKASRWNLLGSWREREGSEATGERAANILKALDSTHHSPLASGSSNAVNSQTSSSSSHLSIDSVVSRSRTPQQFTSQTTQTSSTTASIAFTPPPLPSNPHTPNSSGSDSAVWRGRSQQRGWESSSPPFRSGLNERWERSPASSTYSGRSNATTVPSWRNNQTASAASSMYNSSAPSSSASSTFTRFRNGSEMSFSTMATTVSASSAFNVGGAGGVLAQQEKKPQSPPTRPPPVKAAPPPPPKAQPRRPPVNVKQMHGIPWELDELPRQLHPTVNGKMPMGHIHGAPPRRGRRDGMAAPKPPALDTITERPKGARRPTSPGAESGESDGSGSPVESQPHKKVQKAQINTLAKILTSFKTKRE